jgi:hypothetical protein
VVFLAFVGGAVLAAVNASQLGNVGWKQARAEQIWAFASFAYAMVIAACDIGFIQLPEIGRYGDIIYRFALLVPLLIGAIATPWQRYARSKWAWWLMCFASVASLTYNGLHTYSYVGFFNSGQF